jgi:hypothetical protein
MPKTTFVEVPSAVHAQMLAALRRTRYSYLLALHIVLLCAAGHIPTEIAQALFCWRSSGYRTVRAYRNGALGWAQDSQGRLLPPLRTTVRLSTLRRSLMALRKAPHGRMGGAARAGVAPRWP